MAPDAEAIRTVTRHYPSLLGYQQLPFVAALTLMVAADAMGWRTQGRLWLALPLMLVALSGQLAIGRYYARRFGQVRLSEVSFATGEGCFLALIAYTVFVVLQVISILAGLRVWLGFLVAGIALGATARRRRWLYAQRLLPAAVLVVMSFGLPVERNPPEATLHALMLIGCLAWGVMAVLDHRALVRAFERAGLKA